MNTPAHLIIGAAAFSRKDLKYSYWSALAGAMAPDVSLYVMVAWSGWVMNVPPQIIFGEYYYSDTWQSVFAVDNSFILWGILLALALWRRWSLVAVFAAAGLLHLAMDFPLHTHDARMHFWPLTNWVFESPISYWDSRAGAGMVGPIELGLAFAADVILILRWRSAVMRGITVVLLLMEIMATRVWAVVF